jgi:hypothetical protein
MNIYLLKQNTVTGYYTYDAIVVAAPTAEIAQTIYPYGEPVVAGDYYASWPNDVKDVNVTLLGKAEEGIGQGVILASFNAG